jgi:hypothetical protein
MHSKAWFRPARLASAALLVLALGGCLGMGGSKPEATATVDPQNPQPGQIDVRRYLGPNYCPEIRIREGTELMRRYESGHEEDPAYVVWQASIGRTARECLYEMDGTLTLRVGVSGRVIAGPKGGQSTVALPLRIAVVKYQEAVLASELYPLQITIPPSNSTVFREVRELRLPSPGTDRDYIIYIGLDEKGENLLTQGSVREDEKAEADASAESAEELPEDMTGF